MGPNEASTVDAPTLAFVCVCVFYFYL